MSNPKLVTSAIELTALNKELNNVVKAHEHVIDSIIDKLEDKSIPAVMKHFKANYAGQVDMSVVSKIARG